MITEQKLNTILENNNISMDKLHFFNKKKKLEQLDGVGKKTAGYIETYINNTMNQNTQYIDIKIIQSYK